MSGSPSKFNADDYRTAAREHMTRSRELHEQGFYTLSHYIAGLAVECMLRAYRLRISRKFDERHDLEALFRASDFDSYLTEDQLQEVSTALSEVATRWSNNHRFRSEEALRRYLKHERLDRGITRGSDFVKVSSQRIVDAAVSFVTEGDARWESKHRRR